METTGNIYIIRNRVNDKVYVGQTVHPIEKRFSQHRSEAMYGKQGTKLYTAMREIGVENFYVELLQGGIEESALDSMETLWIVKHNSFKDGYNSTLGGTIGRRSIEEVKMTKSGRLTEVTSAKVSDEYDRALMSAMVDAFFDTDLF